MICVSEQNLNATEAGTLSFYPQLRSRCLAQCPTQSWHLANICRMNLLFLIKNTFFFFFESFWIFFLHAQQKVNGNTSCGITVQWSITQRWKYKLLIHTMPWMNLKTIGWAIQGSYQSVHTAWSKAYGVLEQEKLVLVRELRAEHQLPLERIHWQEASESVLESWKCGSCLGG